MDMWLQIGFTVVIQVLQTQPEKVKTIFRKVFLKINKLIASNFSTDEEFKSVWNTFENRYGIHLNN